MKFTFRKITAILAAAVLGASTLILTGCGSKSDDKEIKVGVC